MKDELSAQELRDLLFEVMCAGGDEGAYPTKAFEFYREEKGRRAKEKYSEEAHRPYDDRGWTSCVS